MKKGFKIRPPLCVLSECFAWIVTPYKEPLAAIPIKIFSAYVDERMLLWPPRSNWDELRKTLQRCKARIFLEPLNKKTKLSPLK